MRTSACAEALFPKTRREILAATFGDPDRWWYMREIARHLARPPSSLQRELAALVRGGILLLRREGKQVYYQAARQSPIFSELQGLLLKTVALADVIRAALTPLAAYIRWAFIYGSVARSEERSSSDVDLMIVGDLGLSEISGPLRKAERHLNRAVNPTIYTIGEFAAKRKRNHHFIATVMRSEKLFVLGDSREFSRTFG
jgi:predicted nucleotidyltransferase